MIQANHDDKYFAGVLWRCESIRRLLTIAIVGLSIAGEAAASTTYGIFDARTMAMGGASVASANNDNAQFYNSALLAFNEEHEEDTQDSRFWFPMIVPEVSGSVVDAEDIYSDDLYARLSSEVTAYNAAPGVELAAQIASTSAALGSSLVDIAGNELYADIYAGMSLSEPGKRVGAGFFLGGRVIASGAPAITDADLDLLNRYNEGLTFIASGGAQGSAQPDLFDINGNLIDPGDTFDSSARAAGVQIIEIGVASSHQVNWFGHDLAAGWSFKANNVRTFEDLEEFDDQRVNTDLDDESDTSVNFDVGLAKDFANGWRVGLAVKDIIPYKYRTSAGTRIRLNPRPRLGIAYNSKSLQLAVDADLIPNEPFAGLPGTQQVSVGAEWRALPWLNLRSGYRHDISGDRGGAASAGVGTLWRRFAFDVAYTEGSNIRALALQFGVAF